MWLTAFGVDSTMLEAKAAMKSIVRQDTSEKYPEWLRRLAAEEGSRTLTEERRRFERYREGKPCLNHGQK